MSWEKSREWLHDMVHYMPRDQIEYIIDELVEHGDVARTEPTKPSILDESWEAYEGDVHRPDGGTVYMMDWMQEMAALPDACRALKAISDILNGAWTQVSAKPLSGEGRLYRWNVNLGQELYDKRHLVYDALKKAEIE